MPTIKDMADMCWAVYGEDRTVKGWSVQKRLLAYGDGIEKSVTTGGVALPGMAKGGGFTKEKSFGNVGHLQAMLFQRKSPAEAVVAFRGTSTKMDLVSDLKLGLKLPPRQMSRAHEFVAEVMKICPNLTLTGHSLGGAIAQAVGYWNHLPFATFNAAPAGAVITASCFNLFKPQVMARSITSSAKYLLGDDIGANFRLHGDPVSSLACPIVGGAFSGMWMIGKRITIQKKWYFHLPMGYSLAMHGIQAMRDALDNDSYGSKTLKTVLAG